MFADVDTGVDDAMALTYLLASPDADKTGTAKKKPVRNRKPTSRRKP